MTRIAPWVLVAVIATLLGVAAFLDALNFLKSKMTCDGIMVVPGGTLTFQALVSPDAPTTSGAVTGGTGAYANARGILVSVEGRSGSKDTITLVG